MSLAFGAALADLKVQLSETWAAVGMGGALGETWGASRRVYGLSFEFGVALWGRAGVPLSGMQAALCIWGAPLGA